MPPCRCCLSAEPTSRSWHVIVWFSLTYDAELYAQLNKRLHRNGQKETVSIVHLLAKGTIDERVLKVLEKKEDHAFNLTKNV